MLECSLVAVVELVGTPDTVAAKMDAMIEEIGRDGFLIGNSINRRTIAEIADGLGPALRRCGLTRDGYDHAAFRDNLFAF